MSHKPDDSILNLTKKQKIAFEHMRDGKNVLITGPAGVGKTSVIKMFQHLYGKNKKIAITSTTGVSAITIGGTTLHSYLGIGLGNGSVSSLTEKIKKNPYLRKKWNELHVLIIDEVSMLTPVLFDKLEEIARNVRCGHLRRVLKNNDNEPPFGGIQLILSGDFLQLPTVQGDDFVFEAKSWSKCIDHVINLTKIVRQQNKLFKQVLNDLRIGKMTKRARKLLKRRHNAKLETESGIKPTRIYTTNANVDLINEEELDKLDKDDINFFQYDMKIELLKFIKNRDYVIEKYRKNCIAQVSLQLCVGAQVMLLHNLDLDEGLANGSRGIVIDFIDNKPQVKFLNGQIRVIDFHIWDFEENNQKLIRIKQMPLRLAWSITCHKCVTGNTIIPTQKGLIKISELSPNNQKNNSLYDIKHGVLGKNGTNNAIKIYKGVPEITYTIVTKRGHTITGSHRHPILVNNNEWVTLPNIKKGDTVWLRNNFECFGDKISTKSFKFPTNSMVLYNIPKFIDSKLCYLIGLLLGDGCYSSHKQVIEFCSHKSENRIISLFQKYTKDCFGKSCKIYNQNNKSTLKLLISSSIIRKFFLWCGLKRVTSESKVIPWSVLQNTRECQISCLKGLFDTDGDVNNLIHYTTVSKQLALDIVNVLLNIGIKSAFCELNGESRKSLRQVYRVQISGYDAHKFAKTVGFESKKKHAKLQKLFGVYKFKTPKMDSGGIPNGHIIIKNIKKSLNMFCIEKNIPILSWRHPIKDIARLSRLFNRIEIQKCKLNYYSFRYICDTINKYFTDIKYIDTTAYELYTNHIYFDKVKSVYIDETKQVLYDIEVPVDHTFIGNGIVNHNSQSITLDFAEVDLSNVFEYGQAYVALSRVRSPEGLSIVGLDYDAFRAHPKAKEFYKKYT